MSASPDTPDPPDAPDAAAGATPERMDISDLAEVMAAFNESTAQLQASHERLQARVEELSGELRVKNDELSARVEEVSSLKNYLANILESTADGVLTINRRNELVALNRAAADILPAEDRRAADARGGLEDLTGAARGVRLEEALDGRCADLARLLRDTMENETIANNVEMVLDTDDEDGGGRSLSVSAAPIRTRQGAAAGAVATFRDNTELRRLEAVLRRRERLAALAEMSAQLAHEIRNPLGGIDLYASLLHRALEDRPEERQLAEKIAVATASLNRLVEDMLAFTRPSEPNTVAVPVEELLEGALELSGDAPGVAGLEVIRAFDQTPHALLDPDLMQRVFLNVILNAVQVTPAGGAVTLATEGLSAERAPQTVGRRPGEGGGRA
ncbi:MAG: histidine kinase dimerization/phospho-acceptor domain-containing protein, partial [Planctomycetota bacterium]